MKRKKALPRLFHEVLDAIAILRESKGSTEKAILNQVDTILHLRRERLKKSIASIHKALCHGVKTGILVLKHGKYCLGMTQGDYDLFRKVRKIRSTESLYNKFKLKRKRKQKRMSQKLRELLRTPSATTTNECFSNNGDLSETESDEPSDCRGRRGRRARGRRRRSRSRRRNKVRKRTLKTRAIIENPPVTPKASEESIKTMKPNNDDEKDASDNQNNPNDNNDNDEISKNQEYDRRSRSNEGDKNKCDLPNCLCHESGSYYNKDFYK
ncbi:unnamed protein product [Phyllotreta striolata]|uniref:Uncharacterized protein n=1 Tax=Phyllotreta striolata TaxID=444603 RepID=A0A9N9TUR9_PHYSR|nr:unnamed protein product [Phyllotreta striolata]